MKEALKIAGTAVLNLAIVAHVFKKETHTNTTKSIILAYKPMREEEKKPSSRMVTSLAGLLSGTLAAVVMYPTEALKKLSQTNTKKDLGFKIKKLRTWLPAGKKLYTGGLGFAASVGPATLLQRNTYTMLSSNPAFNDHKMLTAFISGSVGAICSTVVENTILTQQILLRKNNSANLSAAFKQLYSYGLLKIWTGFTPLVVREGIFGGLALSQSDQFAEYCQQSWNHPYASTLGKLSIGLMGALITHPFDTVATRKQHNMHAGIQEPIHEIFKKVYTNEGIKGFYRGGGWRVGLFTGCMLIISNSKKPAEKMLSTMTEHSSTLKQ